MSTQKTPNNLQSATAVRTAPRAQPAKQSNKLVAIASGKGGVGKTWFSISLSHALASYNMRTLLFDADLGLANVDIQLGLMVDNDIGSIITGQTTINQAITTYERGKFDVIAGRSGTGGLANVPIGRLQLLCDDLQALSASYDRIILDLGAGVDKAVRQFSRVARTLIVVCTDEPTSLTDAYAFIKVTVMETPETDVRIVVNAANSAREGERTYQTLSKACQHFLRINPPLLGIIRRDTRVRDAIRNQMSIFNRHPTSEAAKDVEAIANKLING